tara:strand:+ start:271 stop:483 length:213 start_codon:yes stop_codon:yes gene_type:complete
MKATELLNIQMQIFTAIENIDRVKIAIEEKDWRDEQNKEAALNSIESSVIELDEIEDIVDRDLALRDATK